MSSTGIKKKEVETNVTIKDSRPQKPSNQESESVSSMNTDGPEIPSSMTLPKGGGAIQGIGEKFDTNYFTGTMSLSIPIFTTPSRSGFYPKLSLSYDSAGKGNGPFGVGWNISIPSIARKTELGLPRYNDAKHSDNFILSGSEDLVPVLTMDDSGKWVYDIRDETYGDQICYSAQYYRPRIEGLFALVKKCTRKDTGEVHWRSISKDNTTTIYGKSPECQIFDPDNPSHIFKWLLEESFDDKGNVMVYKYKQEDATNIPQTTYDKNRLEDAKFANKYIKKISYGNLVQNSKSNWFFEVVFDYGEHDVNNDPEAETGPWNIRQDPFSSYRAGFEIRTYRLCKRIMMFHNIGDLKGNLSYLVHSTDLDYLQGPVFSFLKSVTSKGYKQVRKNDTLTYNEKYLPPLDLTYVQSVIDNTVYQIKSQSLENLPVGIDENSYQWVDLESEGISGILSQQDGSWYYKHNLGNGKFAPMAQVRTIPSAKQNAKQQITELDADGQKYVVQYQRPDSGYYKLKDDGNWEPFVAFKSIPIVDWNDSNLKFVDINGDGLADILISQSNIFVWYSSTGKEGFDTYNMVPKEIDEEKGPTIIFADPIQSIYLADMSGDGLSDIVRIKNGEVCYWPNLGYGKFGSKVTMANSPAFDNEDQFDNKRIRLADIDGSGTADIVYIGRNKIKFWFNQSGNSYGDENIIDGFPAIDNLSSIMTVDLLGKGTTCIVWSSPLQENSGVQMKYIDLMGGAKPYLLYSIINNMGSEIRIGYAESTKFYLEDLKLGKPWVTRLPFPVHLVERVETYDYLSNTKLVNTIKYHHGYYDRHEREFRGFGLVEHWDTETFDEFNTAKLFCETPDNSDKTTYVAQVYTKTWYHTGAYHKQGIISKQYEKEYYSSDTQAALLGDSTIPLCISQEDIYEALRSLKGQVLRQEVYGLDSTSKQNDPYTVSEHNYNVTMFQSARHGHEFMMLQSAQHVAYGIFYSHGRETLDYQYECNPTDPRVSHTFVLLLDNYGNIEKQVTVYYPRRSQENSGLICPEQYVVKAVASLTDYTQIVNNPQDTWLVGVQYQSKSYEISGLALPLGSALFDFDYINSVVQPLKNGSTDFNVGTIVSPSFLNSVKDFGVNFTAGNIEARIFSAQRKYYWQDTSQTNSILGQISVPLLPSYTESVVFPQGYVSKIYGSNVTDTILTSEGLYTQDTVTGYWWAPSKKQYYLGSNQFFLPNAMVDPNGNYDPITMTGNYYKLDYDSYNLLPLNYTDPLGNVIQIFSVNYRLLKPTEIIDFNGNHSQVVYDELGMVLAWSLLGMTNGVNAGDDDITSFALPDGTTLDDIISNPGVYVQPVSPTAFFYYDYLAWINDNSPPRSASIQRVLHKTDQPARTSPTFQISILYVDGQGRELQKKLMAEGALAWQRQPIGINSPIQSDPSWITSGRTVYNNKGKPVKQYEPFYSVSYDWDSEESLTEFGVTPIIHYDPLERVIRIDTPKGLFSSVIFDSWSQENWDENDNVLSSTLYDEIVNQGLNPFGWDSDRLAAEIDALNKTVINSASTPKAMLLDVVGHTFMEIDKLNDAASTQLFTYYGLDITGNKLWIIDPRQYVLNQARTPANQVLTFEFFYDMQNRQLESISMDAGTKLTLQNFINKSIYQWTPRDYEVNTTYDLLQRPVSLTLTVPEIPPKILVVEKISYANTTDANAHIEQHMNQIGKPIAHYDQGGIKNFVLYNLEGQTIQLQAKIRDDYYQIEVDWNTSPTTSESFTTNTFFDTFGKVTSQTHSNDNAGIQVDGRQYQYHPSGRLKSIAVQLDAASAFVNYITDIQYNAKSQRNSITYGNGTNSQYRYDDTTFRLESILTNYSNKNIAQDLNYVYDPVGNITQLTDNAIKTIFYKQAVIKPVSKYQYDSLYRLVYAEGRQHPAVMYDDYKNPSNNPDVIKQTRYISINDATAMENYSQTFSYDVAGNLLQIQHVVENNTSRGWKRNNNYFPPDSTNRLQSSSIGGNTDSYSYDSAGNMRNLEQLKSISWNYRENMSSALLVQRDGMHDDKEYYVYGYDGMRTRKVLEQYQNINGVFKYKKVTEKIYLDGFEIKRITRTDLVARTSSLRLERYSTHVMDDKNQVVIIHNWTADLDTKETDGKQMQKIRYHLSNNINSVTLEIDDQEQIISYEEYYPYGGTSFISGTSKSASNAVDVSLKEYRYTGKECDDSTSLYYFGARYYIPWLCRWSSCDPKGIIDGLNIYANSRNNPIRFADKMGTESTDVSREHHFDPTIIEGHTNSNKINQNEKNNTSSDTSYKIPKNETNIPEKKNDVEIPLKPLEVATKIAAILSGYAEELEKIEAPFTIAEDVLTATEMMSMSISALSGEGFVLKDELKQSITLESSSLDLLQGYTNYSNNLNKTNSQAILSVILTGNKSTIPTMRSEASKLIPQLQTEYTKLNEKIASLKRDKQLVEARLKAADIALTNTTTIMYMANEGTAGLATILGAREDLLKIRGHISSTIDNLTTLSTKINEDKQALQYWTE